jgi:non-specific serine/threonine protein kinase
VRLFVERAAAARPGFSLAEHNAAAVLQVCRHLDGIPLAIELAAARAPLLKVEQIAARLDDRFQLLTGGSRTALPRQQTLRATIDWSHDLLAPVERALFRRLAVFAGGWTLESAEAVCAGGDLPAGAVLDLLGQLANKSLVSVTRQSGAEARYAMLETVRQYALERLAEAAEAEALRDQHLQFFLRLAQQAEPMLFSGQLVWFERLDAGIDNLRAALDWSLAGGGPDRAEAGLRLLSAATWFYESRYRHEAADRLQTLLASPGAQARTTWRSAALNSLGFISWSLGTYARGRAVLAEAQSIAIELGDDKNTLWAFLYQGAVADFQGDFVSARYFLEIGLEMSRLLGADGRTELAWAQVFFGDVCLYEGDRAQARAAYADSVALLRALQSKSMLAYPVRRLGHMDLVEGDTAQAAAAFTESLLLNRQIGHTSGMTACLAAFAGLAVVRGQYQRAAHLSGAVEALLQFMGVPLFATDLVDHERHLAALRARLDEAALAAAWQAGRALSLEQAVEFALDGQRPAATVEPQAATPNP